VPADPSSLIPPGLNVLGQADPLRPAERPHLLAYLATVTDPRARALGAGIRWSPSWCWPLPRSWRARGRSPRSPSGPRTHPSPCVPRWGPAAIPAPAAGCGRSPPRPRSAGPWPAWTLRRWPPRPARRQHPAVADRGRLRDHQPRLRPGQPGPGLPTSSADTGRSRTACTRCGM
jgi:hypothetical protein